ncbi:MULTISPECIES: RNA polymerase sigma factor [Rhodopirellula]|uniref:RNA polymerase ECF-type sigma factor n=1 Tax=Rhodopirellula europaea 6C TaxID=1263867 RepID=M2AS52_9BACT|nr:MULTISPECIES: RNA polymerase sigma factor [Rhodopirellula]EMB15497.1 RNA polymerase ECF-type sigma factor [Rhodopirellula europaea 6C]MCR9211820.1 RNA polymerase sigma factor [bacterium]|tara:strand:+ start:883 stop:1386 length:504 start_codon:yes stop_codon:yes gene_type:complete
MNPRQQERQLQVWLEKHQGLLVKVARSFARNRHDQDDLLQEIGLQLWRSIPNLNPDVAESTWIYRVALYTAISWTRKDSKHREKRQTLAEEPIANEPNPDPRVDWLYEKIAELNPIDRSLALMMLDGIQHRDIAETLGLSVTNVGVRLHRIKKHLSSLLDQETTDEL